eukprot:952900_1
MLPSELLFKILLKFKMRPHRLQRQTQCILIQIRRVSATSSPKYMINNNLNEHYQIDAIKTMNSKFISQPSTHINTKIDAKTTSILSKLQLCKDIRSVLHTIHHSNSRHISIYAKALQTCHTLSRSSPDAAYNHKYIKTIFTMIENDNISFNIYFFGILFDILSKTKLESTELLYYFQKMYALRDKVKPNTITLSTLLKCCRKCNDLKLAEKILLLLKGIELDKFALNELIGIYGNNHQMDQALLYFNKLCAMDTTPNIVAYGSMLNAYAQVGDIKSIKSLIKDMKKDEYLKEQLAKSSAIYTALMKGYLNCVPCKPKKALTVFDVMAKETDCKVLDVHILLKATAYNTLIMNGMDEEHKYLDKLLNELPKEREALVSCVNKSNQVLASLQLKGCIMAQDYDFDAVVPMFEERFQQHIGYWRRVCDENTKREKLVLDFYHFGEIITRFILKYIFKYQKEQVLDALDENGTLQMFCDDGLGNKYKINDSEMKFQESSTLKQIIKDEILSWNTSIDVDNDVHNTDVLLLTLDSKTYQSF